MSRFVRFEGYQVDLQTGELRKNGSIPDGETVVLLNTGGNKYH